jgi:pimeloyl-ACP methyl ester carboxylesterase
MLPPASPLLVEELERLERKIWESLIEADARARYFARIPEEPGLWKRVLAAVGGRAKEPAAQLAALQARWSSLLERYEFLWDQLSVQDPGEVDRHWRALQVKHRTLIQEEAEQHRLNTRLAVECEVEALRARGRLEAEKVRILAEIERLREERKKPQDYGSPNLDYYESEALRDRLQDFEAKYRAFGGTLSDEIGVLFTSLSIPKTFCWGAESLHENTVQFLKDSVAFPHQKFENASHWLMVDQAEEFYPFLDAFCDRGVELGGPQ